MKLFICLLFILFVVSIHTTTGQNRFKSKSQKPMLEIGAGLRNQWFLLFPYFPTAGLSVGLNNGKSSISLSVYNNIVSFEYLGAGIKYSRYKYISKKLFLGADAELSIMRGEFAYNKYDFPFAELYASNKYCGSASLSLNIGYQINPKNNFSVYGGLGGVYTFSKIENSDYINQLPKMYNDQMADIQYQVGITYKRFIKL